MHVYLSLCPKDFLAGGPKFWSFTTAWLCWSCVVVAKDKDEKRPAAASVTMTTNTPEIATRDRAVNGDKSTMLTDKNSPRLSGMTLESPSHCLSFPDSFCLKFSWRHSTWSANAKSCIRSFTWQGLETSSSRALDRPTPQRHWICSCQPLETDRPSYRAMMERRDDLSWIRDDDDDDEIQYAPGPHVKSYICFAVRSAIYMTMSSVAPSVCDYCIVARRHILQQCRSK